MRRIRLAAGALPGRIYAGPLTEDSTAFSDGKQDVTSDALKAVIDHVGPGNVATINENGKPRFRITIEEVPGDS